MRPQGPRYLPLGLRQWWLKIFHGSDASLMFQVHQVVRQVTTFLLAVLLAKSALRLEDIGIYEQLFFLGHLLTFFWLDSLFRGYLAHYSGLPESLQAMFLRQAAGLMLLGSLGVLALSILCSGGLIALFTGGSIPIDQWRLFALFLLAHQLSQFTEYVYLSKKDARNLRYWIIFSHLGMLLAVGAPLLLVGHLDAILVGLILYGAMRLAWFLFATHPIITLRLKQSQLLRPWIHLSWPLMVYSLFAGAVWIVDGWIINTQFDDPGFFALYRYGARELPFSNILAASLGVVFIQRLVEQGRESLSELKQRIRRLTHLFFPATIALMLGSDFLYEWVFSAQFVDSAPVFRIYLFILASRLVITTPLFTSINKTRPIMWIGFVELLINAGLSLWWVSLWGLQGVAWATIVAFSFEKLAHLWWLSRRMHIRARDFIPIAEILIYSIILTMAYVLVEASATYGHLY